MSIRNDDWPDRRARKGPGIISPVTLREEFTIAAPAAGLSANDTRKAQQNALQVAFLSDAEKQAILNKKQRTVFR